MSNTKCHGKVRQYGTKSSARFRAMCACGWKGPYRTFVDSAFVDARHHDPEYPRGSSPKDMP